MISLMRNLIFSLWVLFLTTSCTTYYYSTVDAVSNYKDLKNEQGDFVFENDTVQVTYRFDGEEAPIRISVYNKTNTPLYVDWKRSALIVDEVATSYQSGTIRPQGNSISSDRKEGLLDGDLLLSKEVTFIPPYSRVEQSPFKLANFNFEKIRKLEYKKRHLQLSPDDNSSTIYVLDYTPRNTPFYFSSYLTVYTEGKKIGTLGSPMVFDQDFYISRLVKAGDIDPNRYPDTHSKRGDTFYVKVVKGTNAGYIAGSILVGAAGIAIEATLAPNNY